MDENKQQNPFSLKTISAADLAATDPQPPEFVIDGYYPEGLIIKGGSPKIGKSFMSLQEAYAVANGTPFFGRKTKQGDVLLLALEDSRARINKRLTLLPGSPPANLHIVPANDSDNVRKINSGLIDQLAEQKKFHPDLSLVIIDTLTRVKGYGRRQLTSYENDTELMAPLQRFALQNHLAIVCITHLTKDHKYQTDPFERLQGSVGGAAVADAMIVISGKRNETMTLSITGRDIDEPGDYSVRFENGRWEMLGSEKELRETELVTEYKNSALAKTINQLLDKHSGCWIGTATKLLTVMMNANEECPYENAKELGRYVSKYAEIMELEDGITFTKSDGGRHGRDYMFIRDK